MEILFTHPSFWPQVRRGAEREIHDLGTRLVARGAGVRLVTSMPTGLTVHGEYNGLGVRYVRLPLPRAVARRGVSDPVAFAAVALPAALAGGADLVHAWHYGDGWAAVQARRLRRRRPVVLKLTGTVEPDRMAGVRFDRRLFREAVDGADAVWCNSPYAAEVMAPFGRTMDVVPAGIDLDRFRPGVHPRSDPPTVLCASAPDDPRKRLVDVLRAWPAVLDVHPEARLVVAGRMGDDTRRHLLDALHPAARGSVDLPGDLADDRLVAAYATAACVVAPAVAEALGLSTVEALACGTPVAGARSGATAHLVEEGGTGALFEPADPEGCAAAVVRAVALAEDPATRGRCRAAALPSGWDRIVDDVVARYRRLLA